jgi:serine O-acetyltransferase
MKGTPTIGDNVYIAPGAKIIGNIKIGNNCAVGANAVVVKDVLEGTTVGGIPAKVISDTGSRGYINNILVDYDDY